MTNFSRKNTMGSCELYQESEAFSKNCSIQLMWYVLRVHLAPIRAALEGGEVEEALGRQWLFRKKASELKMTKRRI